MNNKKERKHKMQIGMAKQSGTMVDVYDENGNYLFSRPGELAGFTASTVAIKDGSLVCVYDSTGTYQFSR